MVTSGVKSARWWGRAAAMGFAVLMAAAPAEARKLTVDDPWPMPSAGNCILDAGINAGNADCLGRSIGFDVSIGGNVYSTLYLYDDGLVSFGSKVLNPDAEWIGAFGIPVIVTGLKRIVLEDENQPSPYFSDVVYSAPTQFVAEWYYGKAVQHGDVDSGGYVTVERDVIYQRLTLDHLVDGTVQATIDDLTDAYFGYALGDVQQEYGSGGSSHSFTFGDPIVAGVTPGVPEPASWAMLIAGFGLVGAASRRRRRSLLSE